MVNFVYYLIHFYLQSALISIVISIVFSFVFSKCILISSTQEVFYFLNTGFAIQIVFLDDLMPYLELNLQLTFLSFYELKISHIDHKNCMIS